jgi:hypothetical protein
MAEEYELSSEESDRAIPLDRGTAGGRDLLDEFLRGWGLSPYSIGRIALPAHGLTWRAPGGPGPHPAACFNLVALARPLTT